jgi:hypothetical protein
VKLITAQFAVSDDSVCYFVPVFLLLTLLHLLGCLVFLLCFSDWLPPQQYDVRRYVYNPINRALPALQMLEQKLGLCAACVQRSGTARPRTLNQRINKLCSFAFCSSSFSSFSNISLTQPYPPPRSCILVHKKNLCCPYLSCSKYHINYYKNSERNREHMNRLGGSHEKTLEKSSRTDDGEEDANGGKRERANRTK